MTYLGQFSPATRLPQCNYCGRTIQAGLAYNACDDCDTRNLFSDLYKDEHGHRPNLTYWTLPEMRAFLKAH